MVDLHVLLSAPRIVLPAKDDDDEDTFMVVAELGVIEMNSVVQSRAEKDLKGLSVEALQERMYDTFVCKLSNMQIIFLERGEDWEAELSKSGTPFHILDKVKVGLEIKKYIDATGTADAAQIRVQVDMPDLALRFSDSKIGNLTNYGKVLGESFAVLSDGDEEAVAGGESASLVVEAGPTSGSGSGGTGGGAVEAGGEDVSKEAQAQYAERKRGEREAQAVLRDLDVTMTIHRVRVQLLSDVDRSKPPQEVLDIGLVGLQLAARTRKWDQDVSFGLQGMYFAGLFQETPVYFATTLAVDAKKIEVAYAAAAGGADATAFGVDAIVAQMMAAPAAFVQVDAILCAETSPILDRDFNSTLMKLRVNCGTLDLWAPQEALVALIQHTNVMAAGIKEIIDDAEFADASEGDDGGGSGNGAPLQRMDSVAAEHAFEDSIGSNRPRSDTATASKHAITREDTLVASDDAAGAAVAVREDVVTMDVSASFKSLRVLLAAKGSAIIEAEMLGLSVNMTQNAAEMNARVQLDDLEVRDLSSAGSLYVATTRPASFIHHFVFVSLLFFGGFVCLFFFGVFFVLFWC